METDQIYSADQIKVHLDLAQILKEFSKCVIIENPDDLLEFSYLYFKRRVDNDENITVESDKFLSALPRRPNKNAISINFDLDSFSINKENIFSNDPKMQLESTYYFRKYLSNDTTTEENKPNIQKRFVQFLQIEDNSELQIEAAWALTNIASGESSHTRSVIEAGAVPILVNLQMSPKENIRDQAFWALGNIAGDSSETRNIVLHNEGLSFLLQSLEKFSDSLPSTIRHATWYLSNILRGKNSKLNFSTVIQPLSLLSKLLLSVDREIIENVCWSLSYITQYSNSAIQAVLDSAEGIAARLLELLSSPSRGIQNAAFRTVGNIISGTDSQTQIIIDLNPFPGFLSLLDNLSDQQLRKEVCWTISNITAGTRDQIKAVINAEVFPVIMKILKTSDEASEIKKEVYYALSNATDNAIHEDISYLINQDAITLLFGGLTDDDPTIIRVCLEGLLNILRSIKQTDDAIEIDKISKTLMGCGGFNALSELVANHYEPTAIMILEIWENTFPSFILAKDEAENKYQQNCILDLKQYRMVNDCGANVRKSSRLTSEILKSVILGEIITIIHQKVVFHDGINILRGKLLNGEGWVTINQDDGVIAFLPLETTLPENVTVNNHPHALELSSDIKSWNCDGIWLCCKSETNGRSYFTDGWKRYRCSEGCDFDYCEWCVNYYRTNQVSKKYCIIDEEGANIRLTIDLASDVLKNISRGQIIDINEVQQFDFEGLKYIRGKLSDNSGWSTIKIFEEQNGNVRRTVLLPHFPLPDTIEVENHPHTLTLLSDNDGWNCNGRNLNGGCLSGTDGKHTEGWLRYRCEICDFDFCEWCAYAYLKNSLINK